MLHAAVTFLCLLCAAIEKYLQNVGGIKVGVKIFIVVSKGFTQLCVQAVRLPSLADDDKFVL